jgi:predicted ATP-grasp superfamily ATP-dependent carboligase
MASSGCRTILIHEWVTGGGMAGIEIPPSWLVEGRAIRRAVAADFSSVPGPGVQVTMTLDERFSDEAGPWTTVRIGPGEATRHVTELAKQMDYTALIAPETTGTLATLARELEEARARSLGCSPRSIELTGDKSRLGAWLGERGIPTPSVRAIVPADGLPADYHYPAILKPIDGAGSIDTFRIADRHDMPAAARGMSAALIQPFLAGIPMSSSFLVDRNGTAFHLGTGQQRVAIQDGRVGYQGGRIPVACPEAAVPTRRAVESVPGLLGFVGVDFLWDRSKGEAVVLEINPRPTTSYVALCQLLPPGHLARCWLAACGVPGFPSSSLDEMSETIGRQPCIDFDAAGRFSQPDKE